MDTLEMELRYFYKCPEILTTTVFITSPVDNSRPGRLPRIPSDPWKFERVIHYWV